MADVTSNSQAEITTDGSYRYAGKYRTMERGKDKLTDGGLQGVGCTEHDATSLDRIQTLPDHGNNRTRRHVLDQAGEEAFALEISVVYESTDRISR